ncbi:MAG TPA: hypothetical protein VEY07_02915, partial [Thermoplasmata archaeon]|nr:hypothetical protein [Thermoplasmata archaeon]
MTLTEVARVRLPAHAPDGGFDHAAVDRTTGRLYIAHTTNDSVDVVDLNRREFQRSLPKLSGVAGVWVDERRRLLFTSNRGEDTASLFRITATGESEVTRVQTGSRPNGMAFDPESQTWLIAGVGNPQIPNAPPTVTIVNANGATVMHRFRVPGRTRWATFHRATGRFYVNIADPASVVSVDVRDPSMPSSAIPIPAKGPHGLEQDPDGRRLYCACDEGVLVIIDLETGVPQRGPPLAGGPDVLWMNPRLRHLYC